MSVSPQLVRDPALAGPLGTLAFSQVRPANATVALRAVRWHQNLNRLGVQAPFAIAHDVGMIFALPPDQRVIAPRCDPAQLQPLGADPNKLLEPYRAILNELCDSEVSRRAGELKLNDDLVTVVLLRLLAGIGSRIGQRPAYASALPMDGSLFEGLDAHLPRLLAATNRSYEAAALLAFQSARLFVLTMADALDIDTLRLFGMLGSEASGALAQIDLLSSLESPEANDIVNFSLEILPSVLETKLRPAAGTQASHGYSGLGTRGSIDSMVLTELAWDDLELARRLIDNEVLYFAREQSRDEQKRVHVLLVDASASMRGDRQTFARGMAIATGKKLLLEEEEVAFRFFDSRLYELHRAKNGQLPTAHLLSFKGERGRNPARVFAELATDLELMRQRDSRAAVVHLFTHAALYIPRETVQAVRNLAHLAAVFILPSGGRLDLDYLDVLDAHWVVDHATLAKQSARADAATKILGEGEDMRRALPGEASSNNRRASVPPASKRGATASGRPPPSGSAAGASSATRTGRGNTPASPRGGATS